MPSEYPSLLSFVMSPRIRRLGKVLLWIPPQNLQMMTKSPKILAALLFWLHPPFQIACFCGSAPDTLACGMYQSGIKISSSWYTGRLLPNGARGVHLSRRAPPASDHDFRADSSPSPPPTPRQTPLEELAVCATQSRDDSTWACCSTAAEVSTLAHLVDDIFWTLGFKSREQCDKVHRSMLVLPRLVCRLSSAAGTRCYSIGHMGTVAC